MLYFFAEDTTVLMEGYSYNKTIIILNNELIKMDTCKQNTLTTI